MWVQWLIVYFGITKWDPLMMKAPLPLGFIGRKRGVDFRKTTLETFKRTIPVDWYRIKDQDGEIIFFGVVKVIFGGLDDRETVNKFNSAEYAFVAIDQAEETERTDVDVLQGSLRLKYNGKVPPYKQLYTANPADCWLKEDFIDNKLPGKHFIPALHTDNPHLPASYPDTLRGAFRYNKALLSAYLDGDWMALQAENALISNRQLMELKDVHLHPTEIRRIVTCDPSLGGDECVIYFMENYAIKETLILHERDSMKIAGNMVAIGNKWNCPNYAADTTGGQGSAILDRIGEVKPEANLYYINSSESAMDEEAYKNVRAEMHWTFMQKVIDKEIPYPEDEELRRQILAARFKVINSSGCILMEDKKQTKKRIGVSPDRSDDFIIGVYATDQTEPIRSKDAWRNEDRRSGVSGGAATAMAA